jgi:HD-GYP domain-containing protein (c-di-GMP phosphodiesterase class II)
VQTAQGMKRILDHLQREQVVSASQVAAALAHHQRGGARIEEVLLELAIVDEAALLRALATLYRTRFASTERLASIAIDAKLTELVSRRYAEQHLVCPMTFDPESGVLTVVCPDADDVGMLHGLRVAASARDVRAIVVRPAAAKALIAKVYGGDAHAFAILEREALSRSSVEFSSGLFKGDSVLPPPADRSVSIPPPTEPLQTPRPRMTDRPPAASFGSNPGVTGSISSVSSLSGPSAVLGSRGLESFREVISRVIGFYEARDPNANVDHAHHVARVARILCERCTTPLATAQAVEIAALMHDLGKGGVGHLSTFNVAQYPEHALAAKRVYANPLRLFEGSKLPVDVGAALQHMYERFDGRGFPLGQRGREIPLGARILAVADAYADLTENALNPYRRRLSAEEACAVLGALRESVFDPAILDALAQALVGAPSRSQLSPAWVEVLVLDSSLDDPFLLRGAALEAGFRLRIVHTVEAARVALAETRHDLLLVDADDGPWALVDDVHAGLAGPRIPFAAVGRTLERAVVERLGALHALDVAPKTLAPAALFDRLKQALEAVRARSGAAQRGRLQDVELPDVLQGLVQARKTGRLVVRAARGTGEVHFASGVIVDGFFGERSGEDAVVALVRLRDGEFVFDASFKPGAARIHTPTEMLLLEAMRRIDESSLRPA